MVNVSLVGLLSFMNASAMLQYNSRSLAIAVKVIFFLLEIYFFFFVILVKTKYACDDDEHSSRLSCVSSNTNISPERFSSTIFAVIIITLRHDTSPFLISCYDAGRFIFFRLFIWDLKLYRKFTHKKINFIIFHARIRKKSKSDLMLTSNEFKFKFKTNFIKMRFFTARAIK